MFRIRSLASTFSRRCWGFPQAVVRRQLRIAPLTIPRATMNVSSITRIPQCRRSVSGFQRPPPGPATQPPFSSFTEVAPESFTQLVRSEKPVIVEFYTPAANMSSAIQQEVQKTKGVVQFARMNLEAYPQVAPRLNIQTAPTLYVFHKGKMVDGAMGMLPPQELRAFVARVAELAGPPPMDMIVERANKLLKSGKFQEAAEQFELILQTEELKDKHTQATAGLIRCLTMAGDFDGAKKMIDSLASKGDAKSKTKKEDPAVTQALAYYDLLTANKDHPALKKPLAQLQQAVASSPKDPQPRYDFAVGAIQQGKYQEAVNELLNIVRVHRQWNDDAARQLILKIFDALGNDHEITRSGRRQLANALF